MLKNNLFYLNKIKNVVFLGACNVFDELIKINKNINLNSFIVSSPDQLKNIKTNFKIKTFQKLDKKFKSYIKEQINIDETLFVSLGSRWIFNKKIITDFFKSNLVNFHGTRLPYDAGGGVFSWKIIREDRIDNQLVHLVDEGIDTGPILYNDKSIIPSSCKLPIDFENYRNKSFIKFYKKFINLLKKKKKLTLKNQPDYIGRYNPRLDTKTNGWIDWNTSSYHLIRFLNAFDNPYPGASTMIKNNKRVYIKKAHLHGGETTNHPYMSGLISRHDKKWIVVSTRDENMILIEEVLDKKNKNIISTLKPGDRFFTPPKELYLSRKTRVRFNAKGIKK